MELLLGKKERDRLNIFELALVFNLKLFNFQKINPYNTNLQSVLKFPNACDSFETYEGPYLFGNFSEKGKIGLKNAQNTKITVKEYLDDIQKRLKNFDEVGKINKENSNIPLKKGIYTFNLEKSTNKFSFDPLFSRPYFAARKYIFQEGTYEFVSERYFKELFRPFLEELNFKFKFTVQEKVRIRHRPQKNTIGCDFDVKSYFMFWSKYSVNLNSLDIIEYISSQKKLLASVNSSITNPIRKIYLKLHDLREEDGCEREKMKIVFKAKTPNGFTNILDLCRKVCYLGKYFIKTAET